MFSRVGRAALFALLCAVLVDAQTFPEPATLKITGAVSTPLTLTLADLKSLPRSTLHVTNAHEKKDETYEGVLLETLLERAGSPHGEQLRGQLMTSYVVAEADDGYRVVFALAELDGAPLGAKFGPFRLVAPHEKRPASWVRMWKTITVVTPTK